LPAPAPGVLGGPGKQLAFFGAGCFWSPQLFYDRMEGVTRTEVGYTAGHTSKPTYEETCTGRTGHTEAVLVEYDPAVVSYEQLLDGLWTKIDPFQFNGQGGDLGSQYRTGIYYMNDEQKAAALASRAALEAKSGRVVATEVMPASQWWTGERYHQKYLERGGRFGRGQSAAKGCADPIRCYG